MYGMVIIKPGLLIVSYNLKRKRIDTKICMQAVIDMMIFKNLQRNKKGKNPTTGACLIKYD